MARTQCIAGLSLSKRERVGTVSRYTLSLVCVDTVSLDLRRETLIYGDVPLAIKRLLYTGQVYTDQVTQ